MIPETAKDNSVRLYRSIEFPLKWKLEKKLLEGKAFTDPSVFQHDGVWWMFVSCNNSHDLILYFAKDLIGPWERHPRSPVVYDQPEKARCAGRVVKANGKLIRFAQNCKYVYGSSVHAFCIESLDKKNFTEVPLKNDPILFSTGQTWKAKGMHHIDLHSLPDKSYFAAVDGWRNVRAFGLRY